MDYLGFLSGGHQLCSELFGVTVGKIEPGAAADLIVLDYPAPTPLATENLAGHFLFGIKSDHVTDVMIAGKFVMRNRSLVGIETDGIYQKSRTVAAKLWERFSTV
jgi:cytosine/adenosine deaminase-related metal-dependent hydrolase